MNRYLVTGHVTISVHVEVSANSKEEAIDLAERAPMMSLCHQCSRSEPDEWGNGGSFDGEVEILEAEEIDPSEPQFFQR